MITTIYLFIFLLELIFIRRNRQNASWLLLFSLCLFPSILRCNVGIKLSMTDLTLIAIGLFQTRIIVEGKCIYPHVKRLFLLYWVYISITTAIVFICQGSGNFIRNILYFTMIYIETGFFFSYFPISGMGRKRFDVILVTIYFVIGLYGIFNYYYGYNPYIIMVNYMAGADDMTESFQDEIRGFLNGRISSTFIHPLELGQTTIILFSYLLYRKESIHPILKASILFLMILMVLLCGSRSAIIPVLLVCFLYMFTSSTLKFIKLAMLILFVGFIAVNQLSEDKIKEIKGFVYFWDEKYAEDAGIGGSKNSERLFKYERAFDIIGDNVLLGRGQGFIRYEGKEYSEMAGYESLVLQLLVDNGVLGMCVFLLFYWRLYAILLKNAIDKYNKLRCHSFCLSYLLNIIFTGLQGVTFILYVLVYYHILSELKQNRIQKLI